ncbi:MAG: DUF3489 domain-containing protein [Alphaproteobacteria bacterium]
MTSNTLSNAQRRILTEAAKRPHISAELFAEYLPAGARIKVLAALQKNGLLEKLKDGHYITRAGYAALGTEPPPVAAKPTPRPSPAKPAPKASKQATMLAMLEAGTTIAALMEATGWQKHSVHGAMANLKKKQNLTITRSHAEGADRLYKIA